MRSSEFTLRAPPKPESGGWLERLWSRWIRPAEQRFLLRPVVPADAARLSDGLARLSPQSRLQRFLHLKSHLTPEELHHLAHPDQSRHIAWGIVRLLPDGREGDGVAVGHVFRSADDPEQAEFAIAVLDQWHGQGFGKRLTRALADASQELGIRRWLAVHLSDNHAIRHLLDLVGTKLHEHPFGGGAMEVVYALGGERAERPVGGSAG